MKLKFSKALILGALVAFSAIGQDTEPPDDEKVSYALGMKLGLEIKRTGADVNVETITQAIQDVLEGKPTRVPEAEVRRTIQQEIAYQRAVLSKQNKAEGAAFMEKNAKAPGVKVLPDGLQYRVLQAGNGPMPKSDENVTISSRGRLISGKVIDHKEKFQVAVAEQMKGFQAALQLMPAGSKWEIVLPPQLAFGNDWNGDVGPDSTVIFEVELVSISPSVHSRGGAGNQAFGRQGARVIGQAPNSAPAESK
jgi:FKBP-type peptidyl-prolyl cis-trans isomerase